MEHFELLQYTVSILSDLGLRYFVTGSTATIAYGEPRFTNDIDVVVDLPEYRVADLCGRFAAGGFYVSEDAARQAVQLKSQFNLIHEDSGLKVDVIVPQPSAFNRSRFARMRLVRPTGDFSAYFASPEDAFIKKIEYFAEGGSEKHVRDIAGIFKTSKTQIDAEYITEWARKLSLDDTWAAIQRRITPSQ